ncbi:MAG: DUF3662 and FHA domain-containing protein [Candidatus Velthaea sp.]
MNVIARIELACARFVEEAFARVFPSELDPAQVGRKLVAVMQSTPSDTYLVRVHPVDYTRFEDDRDFLESRWSALLRDALPPERSDSPRAILYEDARVVAGSVGIEAVVDERPQTLLLERPDGTRVELRDGLRIGRAEDSDVVVADVRASRSHARIVTDGSGFAIEDADSSNGTYVDGVRIPRAKLAPGNTVTIGDAHFRIATDAG